MRGYRSVRFLLVASLLMSCSGGGDEDAGGTAVPAPAKSASPASTATDPAKAAGAKAAVLQGSDFPPGWAPQPEEEGLDLEITWRDLTRCLGVENMAPPAGTATSMTYRRGLATQARSTVEYTTESSASAMATALAGPRFRECAKEAFTADVKRSAPEGGVPGPVEVAPLDVPQLGQKTFASRITVTVNLQELQVPLFQDFLVIFEGGTVVRMLFLDTGGPFPQELARSLAEKVVGRA